VKLGFFSGAVRSWAPDTVASATSEAGFGAIEWEIRRGGRHIGLEAAVEDAEARRDESEAVGLRVCCVSADPSLSLLDAQSVDAVAAAARVCGAPLGRMFAPPFDPSHSLDTQLDAVRSALGRHAANFAEHGVTLVIELSEETIVPSPELLRRVSEGIDHRAIGALYDPANMVVEGNVHPAFALALLGDYLHHVHVKNEAFVRSEDGRWTPGIVRADEGLVDWPTVFAELRRVGYGGWTVIDHLSGEASVERMALEREIAAGLAGSAAP
jgi:sugar phosphate isomerase/epimerase